MGNPTDITGRCVVCGRKCESTGGCDCSLEDYNHVPLKRVWKKKLVDIAALAALQARLAEAEAQRAVLVAALEHIRGAKWDDIEGQPMIVLGRTPSGLGTSLIAPAEVCRQALANQPPSDLVALVKAAVARDSNEPFSAELLSACVDALLQNQPGFRALIESEDV